MRDRLVPGLVPFSNRFSTRWTTIERANKNRRVVEQGSVLRKRGERHLSETRSSPVRVIIIFFLLMTKVRRPGKRHPGSGYA